VPLHGVSKRIRWIGSRSCPDFLSGAAAPAGGQCGSDTPTTRRPTSARTAWITSAMVSAGEGSRWMERRLRAAQGESRAPQGSAVSSSTPPWGPPKARSSTCHRLVCVENRARRVNAFGKRVREGVPATSGSGAGRDTSAASTTPSYLGSASMSVLSIRGRVHDQAVGVSRPLSGASRVHR
jgi:hypothetical protein